MTTTDPYHAQRAALRGLLGVERFAGCTLLHDGHGRPYLADDDGRGWYLDDDMRWERRRRAVFREDPDTTRPYMTAGAALLIAATIAVYAALVLWGLSEWLA